jgi:hypothetical protein
VRGSGIQKHYEDYSLPNDSGSGSVIPDSSITYPSGCHADDCIGDFMHTSWSKDGNFYGWAWSNKIAPSFTSYVDLMNSGYGKTCTQYMMNSTLTWGLLTAEIDAGRPMVFLVDSNGNGGTDHFVTIVGYSDSPAQQYGCLDTWYPASQVRWCEFRPMSASYAWGVWGGWTFSLRPIKPTSPAPAHGAVNQPISLVLTWSSAPGAGTYDIYVGTSPALGPADLRASQTGTVFDPGSLLSGTTYYWRVDARGAGNGLTTGDVWEFSTFVGPPVPPVDPCPADGAVDQLLTTDLGWSNGGGAVSYDVYFGTNPEPGLAEFRGSQSGLTYSLPVLQPYTTYYWRVDASNVDGTTPGVVWQFRTRAYGTDFDDDGDVDQEDFGHLQVCLSGSYPQLLAECRDTRLNDDDERVDAVDLAIFLGCHSGPGAPAHETCTGAAVLPGAQ